MALVFAYGCAAPGAGPEPLQGIVEFEEHVLGFEIPGRVRTIAVVEGDEVEAGAELGRLDDMLERLARDARAAEARAVRAELSLIEAGTRIEDVRSIQASLTAARASESLAKQNLQRQRQLSKSGNGTTADLDAAEAAAATSAANRRDLDARVTRARHGARAEEIEAARARADAADAAVALSDERISRHVLRTNVVGSVLDVHVEVDEFAALGTAVVTLGDTHHPYVDVFVPQGRIDEITIGQAMHVATDASDTALVGTVEHISRRTEFTPKFLFSDSERPNLVIRVRVRIDSPDGHLHAGVPAFVTPGPGPA